MTGLLGALLVLTASGCSGSATAPEPGEHETKHQETTESLRAANTPFPVAAHAASTPPR